MKRYMLLFLVIAVLSGCVYRTYIEVDNQMLTVEIAESDSEIRKGLMHRESLAEDNGMLFIFKEDGYYPFWMKNTLIPLDMLFINSSMHIVDLIHAVPCEEDQCPNYVPKQKARYVLEVNKERFNESIIGTKIFISR